MENQRTRLTRRLIGESMVKLMGENNIADISVSRLCREAGINRATFYRYYSIPEDVLADVQEEIKKEYLPLLCAQHDRVALLTNVLGNARKNAGRARALIQNSGPNALAADAERTSKDIYYQLLAGQVPPPMRDYAREMTAVAVKMWLERNCPIEDARFAEMLVKVCDLCAAGETDI